MIYLNTNFVGGDLMTASRIRGSQRIRSNAEREKEQLLGFIPVVEDWHAKMCFMEVCQCIRSYVLMSGFAIFRAMFYLTPFGYRIL